MVALPITNFMWQRCYLFNC